MIDRPHPRASASLTKVAAAAVFACAAGSAWAARGDGVAKDVFGGATSAAGPLALVSTTGWTGADLIVGPAGQVATDARNPAAGRVAQGAGMVAAAATTPSFMRQSSGRSGTTETADSSAATDSTDPGALILAGLGLVGLLALRRRDDG